MEDNLVCGWDEFETHAANTIKQLWDDQDFKDVTLATMDDQQINAHRAVLSSSSSFFNKILLKNPQKNLLLYLKDIRYNELKLVLEFMYLGECKVRHEDLGNFIETGTALKIRGLANNEVEKTSVNVNIDLVGQELNNKNHMLETIAEKGETLTNASIIHETQQEVNNSYQLENKHANMKISQSQKEANPSIEHVYDEIPSTKQNKSDKRYKLKKDRKNQISSQFFKEGFFRCDECPVLSDDIDDFKRHKNTAHDGIIYSCSQCQYKSKRFEEGLIFHMLKHGEGLWFHCDQCEFKAAKPKRVKTHRMTVHGSANYVCDRCDYKSTKEVNLHHHMKSKHEGLRYECDQCDHKATLPNSLIKHRYRYHREDIEPFS